MSVAYSNSLGAAANCARATLEHVSVLEEPVEHCANCGDIIKGFAAVFYRTD